MPVYYLSDDNKQFPPIEEAEDGLLAVGGDLSSERLLNAYRSGVFPWYSEGDPILWWSPDPRCVLYPDDLKISKSMRPYLNQERYRVTYNSNFSEVISQCSKIYRAGQEGTWITPDIQKAYNVLHELGSAISVEVWDQNNLVGGLYGITLGKVFCGESMFSLAPNASKFGLIRFTQKFKAEGGILIDCQVHNEHLASLGAKEISRKTFKTILLNNL